MHWNHQLPEIKKKIKNLKKKSIKENPAPYLLGIEEITHSPIKYAKIFNRVE